MNPQPLHPDKHFAHLTVLLQWEAEAEAEQARDQLTRISPAEAERTGNTLVDLAVEDAEPALGGRYIATLVKRNRTRALPWTRLRGGSPVILSQHVDHQFQLVGRGVVVGRDPHAIRVALNEWPEGKSFRLDLSFDEITRQRQQAAMKTAQTARRDRLAQLRDVLLGIRPPRFGPEEDVQFLAPLNEPQQQAVRFALSAEDVAIVHGPPGTGKTTTVIEIIRQAIARGQKVLACAPSNNAVDNLLQGLIDAQVAAIRLGHPARVQAELQHRTLDALVEKHDRMRFARDCVRQALELQRQAGRYRRARPQAGAKREMRQEARRLFADARQLERQAIADVMDRAEVICATTTLDQEMLQDRFFDLLVIDEACQSTEPGCWIPLQSAQRLILAGDHCQLPPTVVSDQAAREGLGISLQERLVSLYNGQLTRRLEIQFRMHQQIMQFSSQQFYDGQLQAADSVRDHRLADLPGVRSDALTQEPVEFVDTAGADYDEHLEPDGESRLNPREAQLLTRRVDALLQAGVAPTEVAIITPYAAQARYLRALIDGQVEIDTVDGFQGREKEAILISTVRSNRDGDIGFLADVRRMNVALTRARRKLIVVGDSATLAHHPFYAALIDYFQQINAYRTVWEEEPLE